MKKGMLKTGLIVMMALMMAFSAACTAAAPAAGEAQAQPAAPAESAPEAAAAAEAEVPAATAKTKDPTTLYVAMNQKIDVIDGPNGNGLATQVMLHVGDPLARSTEDGGIAPCLALSWESLDEFTWQFKLREGVKFTNGEDFNAEAVKVTMEYIAEYFRYSSQFGAAWPVSAEVVDDYTVNIITPAYCPDLPSLLARVPIFAPKQYQEEGAEVFFTHTVGTGPYIIETFDPGLSCTVVANEEYWGGAKPIKKIVFDWVSDQSARVSGLESGDYDFAYVVPLSQVDAIRDAGFVVDVYNTVGTDIIYYNGNAKESSWICNEKFREACSYAIDHQAIKDTLMNGYPTVMAGMADITTLGAINTQELTYDPDKAKQILTEIGYDGTPIVFHYFTGEFSGQDEICEAVASYMEAAGIKVDLAVMEEAAFTDTVKTGSIDLGAERMPGPYYGVSTYYIRQMASERRNNSQLFPEVGELVDKANAYGISEEERVKLLEEANATYWAHYPIIWGVHEVASNGLTSDLKGVINLPNSFCLFYDCYFE